MSDCIRQFVFTHEQRQFVARIFSDDDQTGPWIKHDGHGPVREVRARGARNADKRPGERVLHSSGHTVWLYDWQAACAMARADGWNAAPYDAPNRVERAVTADFEHLRGFACGDWEWIGVGVVACDDSGEFPENDSSFYQNALWGIESNNPKYHAEVAAELASQIEG